MYKQALLLLTLANCIDVSFGQAVYEINGSPFSTADAPIPAHIKPLGEKVIVIDPREHIYGAYNAQGRLIRWGLATAGSDDCDDANGNCRTHSGTYRIYSAGNQNCISKKYPLSSGGAPMPYCMRFNGGEAIHGSSDIQYDNVSHGCVRVHDDDAKWLRYQFIDTPHQANGFHGTKVIVKAY